MAKVNPEGSSGPITVADLPIQAHIEYAKRTNEIGPFDAGLVRDSLAVSKKTEIPTIAPSYRSLELELLEETKSLPLADLPPLGGVPSSSIFGDNIVPHLDPISLQPTISSVKGLEGEKKIAEEFTSTLLRMEKDFQLAKAGIRKFYKA